MQTEEWYQQLRVIMVLMGREAWYRPQRESAYLGPALGRTAQGDISAVARKDTNYLEEETETCFRQRK